MKIHNTSRLANKQIRPLVDFVCARFEFSYMAHLVLVDHDEPGLGTNGWSWKEAEDDFDPTAPSRVALVLSHGLPYPAKTYNQPEVGEITINSWEEEFVLVLGHELRHIDQYWSPAEFPENFELDAEQHGVLALEAYRKLKQKAA